jgi:bifunctional UDP-N-acetylglucosamine pyrophosphorylase/glucosamine-1-phosphate N-acetyltransferase
MHLDVIILAAGQGTRMRSDTPKVLHTLGGIPLVQRVINTACQLTDTRVHLVYGHGGEAVRSALPSLPVEWVEQAQQLGTGHAVQQAMANIGRDGTVLVLYGDVPLITDTTLKNLLQYVSDNSMGLLTVELDDPGGYGRIVRDQDGRVVRIVEHKDASEQERGIREINTGILAVRAEQLHDWLDRLDNRNASGEYYLTDIIEMAVTSGILVEAVQANEVIEVMGINDKRQLENMERALQKKIAERLMLEGVTLRDASRLDVRGTLKTGRDVIIDVNVILEGDNSLGDRVSIGPNVIITDSVIGNDVVIKAHSVIENASIGAGAVIGPFARIRPESVLQDNAHIGNFVEIKKSTIGSGSKINHLSYIGDATVGRDVNIGAGTITCNYDGANKHQTIIGDDVFVGSDTQFIAPVSVGNGATIGAGSTITRDVPETKLTLSRSKQVTVDNWIRPRKKK